MTDISQTCISILNLFRFTNADLFVRENISKHPAIQVIFDGYGEDENTGTEDTSVEKFVLVVDKNSGSDKFKMEPHSVSFGLIQSRSSELQIYAIYDLNSKRWHVDDPEIDEAFGLDLAQLDTVLKKIYASVQKSSPPPQLASAPWPFAQKPTSATKKMQKKKS
jgi:hypothetical protein